MLRIEIPGTYEAERRYVLDVVFREFLGMDIDICVANVERIRIIGDGDRQLEFAEGLFATSATEWLKPTSMPTRPLPKWPLGRAYQHIAPGATQLPLLFGACHEGNDLIRRTGHQVALQFDLWGSIFFCLTRYEERMPSTRDRHDRFCGPQSLAYQEGFHERPIVNEYVELLWTLLRELWPDLPRANRAYRVFLSHDVDIPIWALRKNLVGLGKSLAADLWQRRDVPLAWRRVRSYLGRRSGQHDADPNNTFDFLMDQSDQRGWKSAFFFIASEANYDPYFEYSVSYPWIRQLFRRIAARGHEIGLHGSMNSYNQPSMLAEEFARLQANASSVTGNQTIWGGRQHYLRWVNPGTWQSWEDAGLQYDSTLTFAEFPGFRCGTCYEYPVFNLETRRRLHLRERPLIAMEVSLLAYQKLSREASTQKIRELALRCRHYHGDMTVLWHNNSLASRFDQSMYRDVCTALDSSN